VWPRSGSRCGWVADNGVPLLTKDLREGPQYLEHVWLLQDGILSALSVPLKATDKVIGTLNVGSRKVGQYGEWDSDLLLAIADQVVLAIQNMLAYEEISSLKSRLEQENLYLQEASQGETAFAGVVGESPAIQRVLESVRMVAGTDSTVLVTGETGTGKEVVVRAIHGLSGRKNKILVKVNCAALPAGVIESELFGHEKGSFTGAERRRIGQFEYANGGTLFLDEVGEMPMNTQIKLLRVLEDGQLTRVGANEPIKVNVRMVAATNADLKDMVAKGTFRKDLYYRLNVVTIVLPPLRERRIDIPLLMDHFFKEMSSRHVKRITGFSKAAQGALIAYDWPGNIRQLRNTVERMVVVDLDGLLDVDDLPDDIPPLHPEKIDSSRAALASAGPDSLVGRPLEDVERYYIQKSLELTQGNREEAARMLGIGERTLYRKIKEWGLT
jgi:two-component system response regulator HydG